MKKSKPFRRAFYYIREEKGCSRLRAADLIGISKGYLAKLERGEAPLSWNIAERMCGVYDVDMNELTRYREEP